MTNLKLAIGFPSGNMIHTQFALDLMNLVNYTTVALKTPVRVFNTRGSILPEVRTRIVRNAKAGGFTHLLFLDSDQTFPPHLYQQLLEANKQVIGCNIATKNADSQPTARLHDGSAGGKKLYTKEADNAIIRVWRLGFGVILLKMTVFESMPEPWFGVKYQEADDSFMGEDWWFCEKLEERDVKIYVDQDLSRYIGHIGDWTYNHGGVEEV